jgi:hypothetical protein
LLASANL